MTGVSILLAVAQIVSAQPAAPAQQNEPGSNLTVYLLTMGPGDQVWEKFGHNAIWIHDEAAGSDIAYHWGLFDFADKNFLPNFIKGRMRYSMGAFDMGETVDAYARANRTVWVQQLNFSPAQRQKLADFVAWNIRPENRDYAYDYFRDNCSTRVRDALDNALGGVIAAGSSGVQSNTTYRFHTSRLTQDDWPVFTGTMMGLGEPTDVPITAWEEMFLPVRMKERLKTIEIATTEGMQPLAGPERVLVEATRPAEESTIHRGVFHYLAIALGVLLLGAALWVTGLNSGRAGGVLGLATLWSILAGIAGVLIGFLWGFTDHLYSYRNENLAQLNPVSLILAVLLVRLAFRRRRGNAESADASLRGAYHVALAVAAISVLGFAIQALPRIDQVNGDVIALAMPLHLGVLGLLWMLKRGSSGKNA